MKLDLPVFTAGTLIAKSEMSRDSSFLLISLMVQQYSNRCYARIRLLLLQIKDDFCIRDLLHADSVGSNGLCNQPSCPSNKT